MDTARLFHGRRPGEAFGADPARWLSAGDCFDGADGGRPHHRQLAENELFCLDQGTGTAHFAAGGTMQAASGRESRCVPNGVANSYRYVTSAAALTRAVYAAAGMERRSGRVSVRMAEAGTEPRGRLARERVSLTLGWRVRSWSPPSRVSRGGIGRPERGTAHRSGAPNVTASRRRRSDGRKDP